MKMDFPTLATGGVAGAGTAVFGPPVAAYLSVHSHPLAIPMAAGLLFAALGLLAADNIKRVQQPEKPVRAIPDGQPALHLPEWLEASGISSELDEQALRSAIRKALENQIRTSEFRDDLVGALYNVALMSYSSGRALSKLLAELSEISVMDERSKGLKEFFARNDFATNQAVQKRRRMIERTHGTMTSRLLAAVKECRRRHLLAPAEILWLRQLDRSLWYAVSSLGRHSHFVEAAGSIAHFQLEIATGKASTTPNVDLAIEPFALGALEHFASTTPFRVVPA